MKNKQGLRIILTLAMVIIMVGSLGFGAFAGQTEPAKECTLDLDTTTSDILDNKTIDQNYKLTLANGVKTDVTKVQLEWEISDIEVTRNDAKIWDVVDLKWVDDDEHDTVNVTAGTASFRLTNYSSIEINATVSFETAEYEEGKKFTAPTLEFNAETGEDGMITIETANGNETYSKGFPPKGVISVNITPEADDFLKLEATTGSKYGVYTVTIEPAVSTTTVVVGSNFMEGITFKDNNLVMNIGDKWSDVIDNNSGKTITISMEGDGDCLCTLGSFEYKGGNYVALYMEGEEDWFMAFYSVLDPNSITYNTLQDSFIKLDGNVPESVGIFYIGF